MPFAVPSLRSAAVAVLLVLGACRSQPPAPQSVQPEGAAPPAGPPAVAFLRIPAVERVAISPDGRRIAGLSSNEGVQVVFETERAGKAVDYLTKLTPGTVIHALGWSGNDVLVVGYEQDAKRSERSLEGRRSPEGVVVYDVESSRSRRARGREYRMVALRAGTWRQRSRDTSWPLSVNPSLPGAVLHYLPDDPEHVLINWWSSSEEGASAAIARVRDGVPKQIVPPRPGMNVWYADHDGRVRAGSGRSEDGITGVVLARSEARGPFREVSEVGVSQQTDFEFAGFAVDPKTIYLTAVGTSGRKELFTYDLAANRRGKTLYADEHYDVGALEISPIDGALWAVEVDADKPELHFFDTPAQREQASIDAAFPGMTNRIVSVDRAGRAAIVRTSGDTNPPDYYRYDRERKRMDFLYSANPALDRGQLAATQAVHFTARDGLAITAYLTVPHGSTGRNLPVVVVVHDGPSARARWGWDPVVQFLASRGFAVFQPNYRGSSGYGREHERMGYGQWGLAMQDDLADGVHWLVSQGIANPTRVGIYGVGYGGYAALLAAAKTPELFRAAASFGAVTDLVDLLEHPDHYHTSDLNQPTEGKLAGDRDALAALSPARLASRIRIPVLVGHGLDDPIVHPEQAREMVDAVENAGGKVESYLYRHELHELIDETDRVEFHEKLAAFFARHLSAIESL
jgi:dipeptidyl aminopeptidase/acylaminoacyl peptidase